MKPRNLRLQLAPVADGVDSIQLGLDGLEPGSFRTY